MSCQCPEVHDGREWRPQCEALETGSLASAEAESPEPRSGRCPRCGGSIVRVYFELAKVDLDKQRRLRALRPLGRPRDSGALPMPIGDLRLERVDYVDPEC